MITNNIADSIYKPTYHEIAFNQISESHPDWVIIYHGAGSPWMGTSVNPSITNFEVNLSTNYYPVLVTNGDITIITFKKKGE